MTDMQFELLIDLGIAIPVAALVWRYYRHRTYRSEARYSTFAPRFWVGTVDGCILCPIFLTVSAVLTLNIPRALAASLLFVQGLVGLLYSILMHAHYGQTVGKMTTKVRVVDYRTEGKISFRQACLRESVPIIFITTSLAFDLSSMLTGRLAPCEIIRGSAFLAERPFGIPLAIGFLWFALEILTMLTNKKRRAVHDFIAGTIVVRTNTREPNAESDALLNSGSVGVPQAPVRGSEVVL